MDQKQLEEKVKIVEEGIQKLLDEHNLITGIDIAFPVYNELPEEVKLALAVINKHQPKLRVIYIEKPKEEQK